MEEESWRLNPFLLAPFPEHGNQPLLAFVTRLGFTSFRGYKNVKKQPTGLSKEVREASECETWGLFARDSGAGAGGGAQPGCRLSLYQVIWAWLVSLLTSNALTRLCHLQGLKWLGFLFRILDS